MRIQYDPEVDILVIQLADDQAERFAGSTKLPFGDAVADLDASGAILSLEILNASKKYPLEALKAHPVAYDPLTLAEAAVIAGSTADALRKAIQRGRLKARQIGGAWVVDGPDLDEYLNSRWKREPAAAV